MKKTEVISAFPGVGKSHFSKNNPDLKVLDSDSSEYSWVINKEGEKVRNLEFPNNYMERIKENIGKVDYILLSSHKEVRDALVDSKIPFTLVYPDKELLPEYVDRYEQRGSDEKFIQFIIKNWNSFIDDLNKQKCKEKIVLQRGKFLGDVV